LQEQAGLWQQRGGRGSAQDLPGRPGVRAEAAWRRLAGADWGQLLPA
jgi:hypothetical protein